MGKISNYCEQSKGLPAENEFQLTVLKWADAATFLREGGKFGTAIGLASSAASVVFNFNPTVSLTCTAVCGLTWLLGGACAQRLEPQAQAMLDHFKELKKSGWGYSGQGGGY